MTEGTREWLANRRDAIPDVYQPAEDSELLATAAIESIRSEWRVLEVGVGSGYVANKIESIVGASVIGTDINPHACRMAHAQGISSVRTDIVSAIADETFEAIVFNPPYLPTTDELERDTWFTRAIAGGESGRDVVRAFIDSAERVLVSNGEALVLVSSLTGIDAVVEHADSAGFSAEKVASTSVPYERLVVLRLTRAE